MSLLGTRLQAPMRHGKIHGAVTTPVSSSSNPLEGSVTTLHFTLNDTPGALADALGVFRDHGISMTHLESRPSKGSQPTYDFKVSFPSTIDTAQVDAAVKALTSSCSSVLHSEPLHVPYFPTRINDIDNFSTKTLDAGAELESDHPGFKDMKYRERRRQIVENAFTYKHGQQIPRVNYTPEETETWGVVYRKLKENTDKYAVEEFKYIMPLLEANCGYAPDNIPQLQDISDFLQSCTGFTLRPVSGLLSARDFLNALAFRTFFSTQYIRHHSVPLYTPEPDCVHELMGHVPMFADPDFAEFSQQIGLASLGASDADITRLATAYWFSVEFGLARQHGELKAYGAGLLSSFGELEYACSPTRPAGGRDTFPKYLPWDPAVAADTEYPITDYQPVYFVAEGLADVKARMHKFIDNDIHRGFHVRWDSVTQSVTVDRAVQRNEYTD